MRIIASWPLDGEPPATVPAEFREPCTLVGRDLLRTLADRELPPGVRWELAEEHYSGFLLGLGAQHPLFTHDTDPYLPPGPLTAYVAEQVQDHLAGYEFVQWPPCPGHTHLLEPAAGGPDGTAWWHCRTSRAAVTRVGELPPG
ncbi:hypothetical protein PUR61_27405 [Streptomyces sp. BE20]|uniref:hypothetical protein n=1 Tax=Streptomycetaceae TaxID=2062 RepID=UPI002E7A0567|nr:MULTISPECIES: hypothetical protein [unclassified Streptomyces]MED7954162.1 hypothetical protein [Streptomyces sp. BE303]MEE1825888.1 hypothetical protein [Streptomyces sp. BE20]